MSISTINSTPFYPQKRTVAPKFGIPGLPPGFGPEDEALSRGLADFFLSLRREDESKNDNSTTEKPSKEPSEKPI